MNVDDHNERSAVSPNQSLQTESETHRVSFTDLRIAYPSEPTNSSLDDDPDLAESVRAIQAEFDETLGFPLEEDASVPKYLRAAAIAIVSLCAAAAGGYIIWQEGGPDTRAAILSALELHTVDGDAVAQIIESNEPPTRQAAPKGIQASVKSVAATMNTPRVDPPVQQTATVSGTAILPSSTPKAGENDATKTESAIAQSDSAAAAATKLFKQVSANDRNGVGETLRENPALANALDDAGRPLLSYARTVAMATLLIDAGADHELPTPSGRTPLMWIAHTDGSLAVAGYLIELGAWVGIEDANGTRPVHEAAAARNHQLVDLLVDHGAEIKALDDNHATPLHIAARLGDVEGVRQYLALGADPAMQDKSGATPFDIARESENAQLIELLNPDRTNGLPASGDNIGLAGERKLHFSERVNLGTVFTREWGSIDYKAWTSAGSAWGAVSVPVGQEVMVMVNVPRLDALAQVDPEGIQFLHLRDVPIQDHHLEALHHLTGLRRLVLSGTRVSAEGIASLRAVLPECDIRD